MSVTKLKLMNISGQMKDFETVLYMCITDPNLHIEDANAIIDDVPDVIRTAEPNPYTEALNKIKKIAGLSGIDLEMILKNSNHSNGSEHKQSVKKNKQIFDEAVKIDAAEAAGEIDQAFDSFNELNNIIQAEKNIISDDRQIIEQLKHMGNLDLKIDDLFSLEFFKFRFGHMLRENYESLTLYSNEKDYMVFLPSSIERRDIWGMYFTPRSKSKRIDSIMSSLHFERVRISERVHGTPAETAEELKKEIEIKEANITSLTAALMERKAVLYKVISRYYEKIVLLSGMFDLRKKAVRTKTNFYLVKWIPARYIEEFKKKLGILSGINIEIFDPSEKPALKPPTLLKNFGFLKPFEEFVEMYGLPSYNEFDPTPLLAFTSILFFGMMFGDAGQGLVITIAGFLIWALKRINLARVIGTLGISSMFFGLIYGSVFGNEEIIRGVFKPSESKNMNTILITAIAIGAVIISAAIATNIFNGIKQKNIEKILFSHNGLAGFIFYWGIFVWALTLMDLLPLPIPSAVILILVILCALIIFLREPFSNLISRKPELTEQTKIEFIIENIFEMFEIVLAFVTNTISFIRIGAFALNHAGMMAVIVLLAKTAGGSSNPVVIIIGNIVVIGLEGLIVGIQILRLEFYEIFGRFFEGNGKAFEPSGIIKK